MTQERFRLDIYRPEIGCAGLLLVVLTLCILPYLFVGAMEAALAKLHLWSPVAVLCVFGIFAGSLINIPVRRLKRDTEQLVLVRGWHSWLNQLPMVQRQQTETILAVNVGGCVIPVLLALFELLVVFLYGRQAAWAVLVATLVNIGVCYFVARPIAGLGIAMPALVPPTVAVISSWILLAGPQYNAVRAPVAFIAGVGGPLIGADLLHLRDITRISVGVLSIGGAGTFDGIVLSGMMAALLA
ncbi:MAG: DUF1614 domain-containing protein [Pirellulaceae bacterium]